ncbi:unnamed protein product [Cylindrotheca closterium]|uniref:Uncharacterized protein n=1 Tax=Cylindrotheca closterium TaxID=2856 RepID=A0AAD2FSN1_9STRA|nr:unnamed protein product [Cylindrotheca closterium]
MFKTTAALVSRHYKTSMNSHHNNSTTIPTPIPNGMNYIVDPNRGETLIELSLPFLGEETDLGNVALANKHIRDCHWYYLYVCISQKYPTFQLEGLRPLEEQREKADMCLPPCIVVDPNFAPKTFQPGNNTFPVPLPRQPKILYDPRCIGAFES